MFAVYMKLHDWLYKHPDKKQTAVMNYVSKFLSNFKEFYNEINSATLTGAIDVVIIQQEDGSYSSSPFHVRFGKIGVLRSREKVVDIEINGEPVDIHMKLGETGEAFFVQETEDFADVPSHLATSPIPSYPDIEQGLARLKASEELPIPSKADFEARIQNDYVPPEEGQPVCNQLADSNHSVSMQDSVYYETSETVPPGARSSPTCQATVGAVVVDLESDHEGQSMSTSLQSQSQLHDRKTQVPILNEHQISAATYASEFRSLAKALGHTSISDSALAVIDTRSNLLYTKEVASESSSLTNSHFLPMFLKNETGLDNNADELMHENILRPRDNAKNFLASSTPSSQLILTDDDKQKAKKKRRKRSIIRKRKSREATAYPRNVDTSDEEPEEIFQMDVDDDDEKDSNKTGSSLPASAYKPIIPASSSHLALGKVHSVPSLPDMGNFPSTSSGGHRTNSWQYKSSMQLNLESHPFSDGDVTPVLSPVTSRPPTPKSDTEYETQRQEAASQTESGENRWSWTWGELPVPPKANSEASREQMTSDDEAGQSKQLETADQAEQRSMLGGMFRFMRKTKKLRHQPESEGIYLDDLNLEELDPEIAKLYFPPRNSGLHIPSAAIKTPTAAKDEDVESGNGSSLPVSPHSVEGGMGSIHGGIDSDSDDRHPIFDFKGYNDLAMSLCGGLTEFDSEMLQERFLLSLITYDEFCENPNILNNPDLVIRLNNKHYNWQTVAPMVLSLILYQRPLSEKTVNNLINENMPKKTKKSEPKAGYSSWFSWRRSGTSEDEAKKMDERKKTDSESSVKSEKSEKSEKLEPNAQVEQEVEVKTETTKPSSDGTTNSASDSPTKSSATEKVLREENAYASTSSEAEETGPGIPTFKGERLEINKHHFYKGNERYKKTLRLTSEQISLLNLREGANEVVFSVTTAYQGTTRCKCHIYLWHHDDKIVVSDIDGTITKSDVLGHILPIIGKDWAQSGVAQLFTKIKNNGYQFLYLSARAIGQAHITREYLKSIRQGDLCLPEGPLLLNPSSLISAFHREVIEKKPEEFKISCLKDIQALFPTCLNPFYAGYGNRINDVWAYRAVGIPMSRIFTINHRGELKHELTNTFQSTYSGLSHVVDHLFPPLRRTPMKDSVLSSDFEGPEEFSAFTYWRPPIPEVEIPESPTKSLTDKCKTDEKAKPAAAAV